MAICKYFQAGNCRFGSQCRFEHPGQATQATTGGNRNNAPSGPRGSSGNYNNTQGNFRDNYRPHDNYRSNDNYRSTDSYRPSDNNSRNNPRDSRGTRRYPMNLDPEVIRHDLTGDRPIWPFSNYAPTSTLPRQLLASNLELSAEELRVQSYANPQGAGPLENELNNGMSSAIKRVLDDLPGAIQYLADGQNEHPNRLDICQKQTLPDSQRGVFGVGMHRPQQQTQTQALSGGFGQPSGQPRPAFGQPSSFGNPQQTQAGTFGQPSAFGANQAPSAFGQPSGLGMQNRSAFGQPSQPGLSSGFPTQAAAQPSAFGRPSFPGGAPNGASPFSQVQGGAAGASPFGALQGQNQPSQLQNEVPMQSPTASGFQNAGVNSQATAFNQPKPSAFGQPSNPSSFGQPSKPSPFGQPSNPSPFGQPSQPSNPSPFGQPSQPSSSSINQSTTQHTPSAPRQNTNSNLRITYDSENRAFTTENGRERRVFFPNGPPEPNPDIEPSVEAYGGPEKMEAAKGVYVAALKTGRWPGGMIPEVAPRVEWNDFNV